MFKYQPGIQSGVEVVQMHYYPEASWRANDLGAARRQEQLDSRNQLPWSESGFSSQHSQSSNVALNDWKPGVQPRQRKTTTVLAVLLTFMTMVAISLGVVLGMQRFHAYSPSSLTNSTPSTQNSSTPTPGPTDTTQNATSPLVALKSTL